MHSLHTKSGYTLHYNSDLSGDVHIIAPAGARHALGTVSIPAEDLLELVGDYVRSERISELEQMTAAQILGLKS